MQLEAPDEVNRLLIDFLPIGGLTTGRSSHSTP